MSGTNGSVSSEELERIARVGRFDWDPRSGRLDWSRGMFLIYGLDPRTFTPTYRSTAKYTLPSDRGPVNRIIGEALRSGSRYYEFEYRLKHPDGQIRTVRMRNRIYRDKRGRPIRLVGTAQDVTAEAHYLASLERTSTLLSALVRCSPFGISAVDKDGRLTVWNPAMTKQRGWSAEEVIGRLPRELPFRRSKEARRLLRKTLTGESFAGEELKIQRKGGGWFHAEAWGGPLEGAGGRLLGGFSILQDVEPRKNLERAVLESVTRERRQFSSTLHDDLIHHLYGITHRLTSLQGEADEKTAAALGWIVPQIEDAVRRTRKLAQGLDPMSIGRGGLREALVRLSEEARETFGLACSVRCEARPPSGFDASTQLFMIAQEAVRNATRHGHAKRVRIRLARSGGRLALTVTDDGVGLKRPEGRGGMGLRIMQFRAESIGGRLTIRRLRPRGTLVRCELP